MLRVITSIKPVVPLAVFTLPVLNAVSTEVALQMPEAMLIAPLVIEVTDTKLDQVSFDGALHRDQLTDCAESHCTAKLAMMFLKYRSLQFAASIRVASVMVPVAMLVVTIFRRGLDVPVITLVTWQDGVVAPVVAAIHLSMVMTLVPVVVEFMVTGDALRLSKTIPPLITRLRIPASCPLLSDGTVAVPDTLRVVILVVGAFRVAMLAEVADSVVNAPVEGVVAPTAAEFNPVPVNWAT